MLILCLDVLITNNTIEDRRCTVVREESNKSYSIQGLSTALEEEGTDHESIFGDANGDVKILFVQYRCEFCDYLVSPSICTQSVMRRLLKISWSNK